MPATMTTEATVTITVKEYDSLRADSRKLTALEVAGVDNWDGYGYALDILEEIQED